MGEHIWSSSEDVQTTALCTGTTTNHRKYHWGSNKGGKQDVFMKMINTHSNRIKRAACDTQGALDCIQRTADTYLNAIFDTNYNPKPVPAGEKPDYQERKTCNFLLDSAKCFDFLEHCGLPAGQFEEIKENSLSETRKHARMLLNWDDTKCQFGSDGEESSYQLPANLPAALLLFASFWLV